MTILGFILLVAFLVWLVAQLVPAPAWLAKASLILWMAVATVLLVPIRIAA